MQTVPVQEAECAGCRAPNVELYAWGGCKLCGYMNPKVPAPMSENSAPNSARMYMTEEQSIIFD